MAENPCVPKPKRTYSEHDLWFPEPAAALTLAPTWLRRIGRTTDGQAVTLAMVLEEEPPTRHEDRIAEHRQALEAMIELSEVVLGSTPVGAAARGPVGFNLLAFTGELTSVLRFGEPGSRSIDLPQRRACLESIAAATLNAAGCLVGGGVGAAQRPGALKEAALRGNRVGDGPRPALERLHQYPERALAVLAGGRDVAPGGAERLGTLEAAEAARDLLVI